MTDGERESVALMLMMANKAGGGKVRQINPSGKIPLPLPRALCAPRAQTKCKTSGRSCRENAMACGPITVIASKAKQSISPREERMDCFAALATTWRERNAKYRNRRIEPKRPFPSQNAWP
jgi:hypothetical protein